MSWIGALRLILLLSAALSLSGCLPAARGQLDEEKEPHYIAGKNRVSAMDYKGAIDSFRKALEVNPQSSSAHFELGWLFDQKEADAAAAIYHYQSFLDLRPEAENGEMVKTRIMACKQELARTVSLGPIAQNWQKEFDSLAEENKKLRNELEGLRVYVAQLQELTNRAAVALVRPVAQVGVSGPTATSTRPPASARTHVVKPGETPSTIARTYRVRIDSLMAANPGVEPRRLRVGQTLNIPPR